MSDFLDEVAADCVEAEADLGGYSMNWSGVAYPAAATTLKRGAVLVIGGKEVEITITLRVRWTGTNAAGVQWEWTADTMPKTGDKVTWKGKTYRIAAVNNAHETFVEFDLIDANR